MIDIQNRIIEVLTLGKIMSLATVDEGGPWAADLIYIHDDQLRLYWISRKTRRHSVALRNNSSVACSITVSQTNAPDLGLQIAGHARELLSPPRIAKKYWIKRGAPPKQPITDEHAWYQLAPTKIELIDEASSQHEKKILEL